MISRHKRYLSCERDGPSVDHLPIRAPLHRYHHCGKDHKDPLHEVKLYYVNEEGDHVKAPESCHAQPSRCGRADRDDESRASGGATEFITWEKFQWLRSVKRRTGPHSGLCVLYFVNERAARATCVKKKHVKRDDEQRVCNVGPWRSKNRSYCS